MNRTPAPEEDLGEASREEIFAALFANLVVQQANLALVFLGKAPHPETGETAVDLESARLMIDQLEMLEFKTRGNLDRREAALLQQGLTAARMAFVEAVGPPGAAGAAASAGPSPAPPAGAPVVPPAAPGDAPGSPNPPPTTEDETRKRFVKKY
ncbi:MAG: DUF1844 domain-containing protein [Verrucomicrobia bacterium]|nr:DUF1844 domain-containing protein [Verrucomicrobiota bacterium]